MGISSSLNAGVSGLNANANKLATISDNIANSQTNGYKRADIDFQSISIADSKSPSTTGGGRWFNAGGVRTAAIWDVDAKGQIVTTTNSTDIAIGGRGFLPVTATSAVGQTANALPFMLTSTGSFKMNDEGYLATTSGLTLLGWPAGADGTIPSMPRDTSTALEPVKINTSSVAMQPTSTIDLNVNLSSDDVESDGSGDVRTVTIEYFDNIGGAQTLTVSFTPTVPAVGSPRSNEWTMEVTDQASGTSLGTGTLLFNDTDASRQGGIESFTGGLAGDWDATTGNLTLNLGNQTITMAMGSTDPALPNHLTQTTSTFNPSGVTHDGNGAGTFTGVSIDENGMLSATYSTGFSKVIYQIPVVDVPNPDGLTVLDNQTFGLSPASGSMYLWDAGTGPVGSTEGFALESSTTDIAQELTQLIQTQRAYSSNAKVITTVDEMLQETTNLKR